MLADERYLKILDLVKKKTVVRTQDLIEQLGVSRETIRRDLSHLEEQGLVKRVYGGITHVHRTTGEPPYQTRETSNIAEKEAIGRAAAQLVKDGEVVLLDGGTTVTEVARHLYHRNNLTIITNSLRAAYELVPKPSIKVYMLGGHMRDGDFSTSGYLAESALRDFYVDKAIIGAGGVSVDEGVTDYYEPEARLRRLMAERAKEVILVADHSKIGVVAFVNCCGLESIDVCVTDDKADQEILGQMEEQGVKVILAR